MTATEHRIAPEVPARAPRTRTTSRVATTRRVPRAAWDLALYAGQSLVATLVALGYLGMFTRPLGVPLVYSGDALSGGSQVKGVLENGWYEQNPGLGAPFGQNLHDIPVADNMQFVFAKVLGLFSDQWAVVYNLAFLVTFPLTAMAALWFIRVLGGSRLVGFVFGLVYAFTPYHFIHSQPHLALSMLFVVPLYAGLVVKVLDGRSLWPRREGSGRWNPLGWLTSGTLGTIAILALTGTTSSYYAVFGLILTTFAVAVMLLRRRWRAAGGAVVAMVGLIVVMVVNMLPDMLHVSSLPESPAAFDRRPLDSEIYALKLASLLFPAPWHRIDALSTFRLDYDGTFPNAGESPTLGIVAAIGFVFLIALPLVLALTRRPLSEDGVFSRQQRHLALLTLVGFLFGTLGGFGTVFALLVSPDIRAWNRFVVYIALFSLASVALLTDQLLRRLPAWTARLRARRGASGTRSAVRPAPALGLALVVLVGVVGVWDEAAPPRWTASYSEAEEDWANDAAYVADIEQTVPEGTSIFQLPVLQFPESPPIWDLHDYDPMRPYLHSTGLSWSYGGVKGRPRADWQATIAALPPLRMAVALAASGFGGIHLDRFGYPNHNSGELEQYLNELLGAPIESPDKRWAFFDLAPLRAEIERDYSEAEVASITRHTIRQPVFYWQKGFASPLVPDGAGHLVLPGTSAQPRGVVDNPGGPIPLKLTFTIRAIESKSYPADVQVTWPDGEQDVVSVDQDGTEVSHSWTAAHGQQSFVVAGVDMLSINLADLVLRDPALYFPLRGSAGDLSDEKAADKAEEKAEAKAQEKADDRADEAGSVSDDG